MWNPLWVLGFIEENHQSRPEEHCHQGTSLNQRITPEGVRTRKDTFTHMTTVKGTLGPDQWPVRVLQCTFYKRLQNKKASERKSDLNLFHPTDWEQQHMELERKIKTSCCNNSKQLKLSVSQVNKCCTQNYENPVTFTM